MALHCEELAKPLVLLLLLQSFARYLVSDAYPISNSFTFLFLLPLLTVPQLRSPAFLILKVSCNLSLVMSNITMLGLHLAFSAWEKV